MTDFLDRYVPAWLEHVKVSGPDADAKLEALLAVYSDDAEYEDVPTGHSFKGHDGIASLAKLVSEQYDVTIKPLSAQSDGERFAIEFESTMRMGDDEIVNRGVAVGTIGPDGKATSHRDYYDRSAFPAG